MCSTHVLIFPLGIGDSTLEDKFFEYEVKLNLLVFMQQFHFASFFSWMKLKEQECRNVVWIAECIAQKHKTKLRLQNKAFIFFAC